jgi:hypothetical protein
MYASPETWLCLFLMTGGVLAARHKEYPGFTSDAPKDGRGSVDLHEGCG